MKKRMILALVLVFALLCLACSNDADEGTGAASGAESSLYEQSVSVAETSTESSVDSTSSADGTSGETSTESASSADETSGETSGTTTSAESTSSGTSGTDSTSSNPSESRDTNSETSSDTSKADETSTGTESSATSSDTTTSSKPAENSENSKPTEGSENSDTSSGSGNTNPSQTAHKHSYKTTVVKPTCTEDGYTLHKCSCGDSYTDNEVPATGHRMSYELAKAAGLSVGYEITKAPTATERGKLLDHCANAGCDYKVEREVYSWNEIAKIEEERILYWINKYRAEEGAPTLTMSEKLTELAEYRAQQALQGGEHEGHNSKDASKACEAVKCGIFDDYTIVDDYGHVISPHWTSTGREAWHGRGLPDITIVGDDATIDSWAKKIVDAFRASSGHWEYVGGASEANLKYVYVGVGVSIGNCYVNLYSYNPDEKGYEHITMDADGRQHSEWVKD